MDDYPGLSTLMSTHPDLMIFRAFERLNMRNLLYYQAEIANVEAELDQITLIDRACLESPRKDYAADWAALQLSNSDEADGIQWQLILKARGLLEKYSMSHCNHKPLP